MSCQVFATASPIATRNNKCKIPTTAAKLLLNEFGNWEFGGTYTFVLLFATIFEGCGVKQRPVVGSHSMHDLGVPTSQQTLLSEHICSTPRCDIHLTVEGLQYSPVKLTLLIVSTATYLEQSAFLQYLISLSPIGTGPSKLFGSTFLQILLQFIV